MFSREVFQHTSVLAVSTAVGLAFIAWSGTQVYVMFCAPSGFTGFIQSLVTMDSSPCQALFAIIGHSQTLYAATVASLLFAFISLIGSCLASNVPNAQQYAGRKNFRHQ